MLQIATEFVKRYYEVLTNHPRYLSKFYKEESTFTFNGDTVKTQSVRLQDSAADICIWSRLLHILSYCLNLQAIQEKVLSTIQGATAHATHVDAQDSAGSGVLLQVVGTIKYRDVSC